VTRDELAAWVAESRREQGRPPHVENLGVLARVAALLAETVTGEGGGGHAP
jgi:hypothetical protein